MRWAGSGYFEVRIGPRTFRCLRVIGQEAHVESEHCAVTETYVADTGRTVLSRGYCRAGMERFPTDPSRTITLDGVTFEHFEGSLTDTACGT